MASGRFLSISIADDDRLGQLSMAAEFLYLKAIPHLDRDGMITAKPGLLWSKVCPLREELFGEMAACVEEWMRVGLVIHFMTANGPALFFCGFLKNNNLPHYKRERPSRFSPPPGYWRGESGLMAEGAGLAEGEERERDPYRVTEGRERERDPYRVTEGREREGVMDEVVDEAPWLGGRGEGEEEDQDQGEDQDHSMQSAGGDGAMNDGAMNDEAMNDEAMNDEAMDDGAMDDGAMNDEAMNDGAMNDGAMNDGAKSDGAKNDELAEQLLRRLREEWITVNPRQVQGHLQLAARYGYAAWLSGLERCRKGKRSNHAYVEKAILSALDENPALQLKAAATATVYQYFVTDPVTGVRREVVV